MFRKSLIRKCLRERFFVTPRYGDSFSGVLMAHDRAHAVFTDVKVFPEGSNPEPVAGDVYIRHANIAYMQRLPNADD